MFSQRNNPYCELLQKFVRQRYTFFLTVQKKVVILPAINKVNSQHSLNKY
jgi:metallophosphoesterase superfamily enzyme